MVRLGGGGQLTLRVTTSGRDSVVATWYEDQVAALRKSEKPAEDMKRASAVVADLIENDVVRFGLAGMRSEQAPDRALASLDDARLKPILAKMLAPERAFATSTPSRNIGSIVVLALFGLAVVVAVVLAARSFLGR